MTFISLRAALDMLPHYTPRGGGKKDIWTIKGTRILTNARVTPRTVDRAITKILARFDWAGQIPIVKRVDVTGDNVWVLHRHLRSRSLEWLYRHLKTFQKLPYKKLPLYVLYKGRIIVWNGTHRMTLGRLTRTKIRARVIDLDAFLRREKKHGKAKHK